MTRPVVVVVGLGPAGPELVTPQTSAAIAATSPRFVRTTRHPAASLVPEAESFDPVYEAADTFDQVYLEIADVLASAAARHGRVLYAVPGSPRVLERSVEHLVGDGRVDVEVVPAMSFLDLAWARLGIDPVEEGVRLVDGHTFATAAAGQVGPLLVAHCHNRRVLSDIKLAAEEPGSTPVTVLQRLGGDDEEIFEVGWADLDRGVVPDHLTSLYIPRLASPVAAEVVRFHGLVETLRRECPWDREQTHDSLRRHLVEEAYEVLEAIDAFDPESGEGAESLEEELGDLLFQVVFHSVLAAEEGWFDLAGVARTVHDKLHARHPHVFGDVTVSGTAELVVSWEAHKIAEKGRGSVLDGVPASLPALTLAEKTVKKAAAIDVPLADQQAGLLADRLDALADGPDDAALGQVLLSLVAVARRAGVDPEMALRAEIARAGERIRRYEQLRAASPGADAAAVWDAVSG